MAENTSSDLDRIYDKIDANADERRMDIKDLHACLTSISVRIAELNEHQKMYVRPCIELVMLQKMVNGHLINHKESSGDWRKAAINAAIHIAELLLVAGAVALLVS